MSYAPGSMVTHPLSDNAILLDFGNVIQRDVNTHVIEWCEAIQKNPFPGFIEVVPAYSSAAIFYDPIWIRQYVNEEMSVYEKVISYLESLSSQQITNEETSGRKLKIPVCYAPEYGPDAPEMCDALNLSLGDLIRLHTGSNYHVYMLGFLPGFPYMGEVENMLYMPRKITPALVKAGSVGIAGLQTGIYPADSPGGWHIIGRTPMTLFDPLSVDPVLFRAGDTVTFYSITADEFEDYPKRNS